MLLKGPLHYIHKYVMYDRIHLDSQMNWVDFGRQSHSFLKGFFHNFRIRLLTILARSEVHNSGRLTTPINLKFLDLSGSTSEVRQSSSLAPSPTFHRVSLKSIHQFLCKPANKPTIRQDENLTCCVEVIMAQLQRG